MSKNCGLMNLTKSLLALLPGLLVVALCASAQAAIFGADDRVALNPTSPAYELSRSTAIAVLSTNFEETSPGKLRIDAVPEGAGLCTDERFYKDPVISYACSGFLVAPDLIVTAGHCMVNTGESRHETDLYCPTFSWLFDFIESKDGTVQTENVPADKLYRCKQVVYAIKEEVPPYRDFALVQLERPVTDRTPLTLAPAPVHEGDAVSMIGYPLGTPAKLSHGAKILLNNPGRQSYVTNLDAFEGNSGSAVFNAKGEVAGILVAGFPILSFTHSDTNSCSRFNRCSEDGKVCELPDKDSSIIPGFQITGSEVQRITPVIEAIQEFERSRSNQGSSQKGP